MGGTRNLRLWLAAVATLIVCEASHAGLGLVDWGYEARAARDNLQDRHGDALPLMLGMHQLQSMAVIGDTSVSANATATLADDFLELSIQSQHVAWPPEFAVDGSALASATALIELSPDQDVQAVVSAVAGFSIPHDDTSLGLVFEVLDQNFDLVHRSNAGTGVPGAGSRLLNDEITLTAGVTYYVSIEASLDSYDETLPLVPATADSVYTLTMAVVPEPAMVTAMIAVCVLGVRRR